MFIPNNRTKLIHSVVPKQVVHDSSHCAWRVDRTCLRHCSHTSFLGKLLLLLWLYSPLLGLGRFFSFLILYAVGRTPWTGDQPVARSLYLHTAQHKHSINAYNTDIYSLCGIRTHDPNVRASEDSSRYRPRGHCDRLWGNQRSKIYMLDVAVMHLIETGKQCKVYHLVPMSCTSQVDIRFTCCSVWAIQTSVPYLLYNVTREVHRLLLSFGISAFGAFINLFIVERDILLSRSYPKLNVIDTDTLCISFL
jgi:hypothetical protein